MFYVYFVAFCMQWRSNRVDGQAKSSGPRVPDTVVREAGGRGPFLDILSRGPRVLSYTIACNTIHLLDCLRICCWCLTACK
jgi:hypothetical protein